MARTSKYPVELKERAVAMVRELERELGRSRGAIARVAQQLGLHPEVLRGWVRAQEKGRSPSGERVDLLGACHDRATEAPLLQSGRVRNTASASEDT